MWRPASELFSSTQNHGYVRDAAIFGASAFGLAVIAVMARALKPSLLPRNPVVVITGGSRGLGLAIAERFGRAGARLVLASQKREELEEAQQTLLAKLPQCKPEDFYLVAGDLSRKEECQRLIAESLRRFGRIDVLVNNAGIIEVGPVESQDPEAYEKTMRVNFFAALHTTLAALPHLLASKPAGNGHRASIVNIASIGGKLAVPHMLPYSAAKFALVGFSEGLHAELRCKGIRVTTVCPGLMRTGGEAHAKFVGNKAAEKKWFDFAAKTPGVAVTPGYAASRIFTATSQGRAEITISPQAWLMARGAGLAPATTQFTNALVNEYLLPAAPPS
jgi:NAD(P)-dependent dehydrogenase (short-subunit alcohol dehydrogenase family)